MTAGAEPRTSVVGQVSVREVTLSSILKAGDCVKYRAAALALAVQRQIEMFNAREGDKLLVTHPAFDEPIEIPIAERSVEMRVRNVSPNISVGRVDVLSVSSSSMLGVGSVRRIVLESRVVNIRQLIPGAVPQVEAITE